MVIFEILEDMDKNRELRYKKELEKSASQIQSIVDMFLTQQNKKYSIS